MKKLKMKDKWLLGAGVLGGIVIGTSLIALIRVLRHRGESEEGAGDEEAQEAQDNEGEQPVRHRRHGRHGDRRAKAGASEERSNTEASSPDAASAQRH
ncbi:MAG: hypothetical protein U1A78_16970 [Polyangia bacterium]